MCEMVAITPQTSWALWVHEDYRFNSLSLFSSWIFDDLIYHWINKDFSRSNISCIPLNLQMVMTILGRVANSDFSGNVLSDTVCLWFCTCNLSFPGETSSAKTGLNLYFHSLGKIQGPRIKGILCSGRSLDVCPYAAPATHGGRSYHFPSLCWTTDLE